jgi:Reverse transcriptase (RNA-dependent DNA polymerase)
MSSLKGWKTKTFDFVQAFPQAPSETELYVDVPKGCNIGDDSSRYCMKILNNIYGQKQAGRVWYQYMTNILKTELGYTQSKFDPCVLWKSGCIIVIYTDDTVITGPSSDIIDRLIQEIGGKFKITSEDSVNDFLGVNIQRKDNGQILLTQPKLIDSIIADLGLNNESTVKRTPAISSKILQAHLDSPEFNESWHYRSVIGKLNYLEKSTRPDIAYAVHQCARFSSNPRYEHGKAIKHIGRYLLSTRDKGIICDPTRDTVHCYADADFAGNWNADYAVDDRNTARSRTGFVIKYASMPITWASKMQTEIALSSTESEYIALSMALRETLPMIGFLEELIAAGFEFNTTGSKIICKAFEDNEGALEMARSPKFRP